MSLLTVNRLGQSEQLTVNVGEAHHLWVLVQNRQSIINHLKVQLNFLHDKEFIYIMTQQMKELQKESEVISQYLEQINTKGPNPAVAAVNTSGNTEVTYDKDIGWLLFRFLGSELNYMLVTLRDYVTNDQLRQVIIKITRNLTKRYHDLIDYLILKNWIYSPPLYPYVASDVNERITNVDVYHLWQHLEYRYSNSHLTRILSSYSHDKDFKGLLMQGVNILEKQIKIIEKTLVYYGVALPKPFSRIIPTPETTELLDDQFIYLILLQGMQNAAALHGAALIESFTNKKVRHLFSQLFFSEMNMIDKMVKYGKLKGWTSTLPNYKMK